MELFLHRLSCSPCSSHLDVLNSHLSASASFRSHRKTASDQDILFVSRAGAFQVRGISCTVSAQFLLDNPIKLMYTLRCGGCRESLSGRRLLLQRETDRRRLRI